MQLQIFSPTDLNLTTITRRVNFYLLTYKYDLVLLLSYVISNAASRGMFRVSIANSTGNLFPDNRIKLSPILLL